MNIKNFLWAFPFLAFLSGYYIPSLIFGSRNEVEVPTVVGTNINQAAKILSDNNLNLRIIAEKEDDDLQEGTIITQTPLMQKVKTNQCIYLVVSKKPQTIFAPELRSKKIKDIEAFLNKNNLRSKTYYLDSNIPTNECIAQLPYKSEALENNKMVLYMSSGNTKPVVFPDLRNLDLIDVKNFLQINNISVTVYTGEESNYVDVNKKYIVIDQKPLAGSIVSLDKIKNVQLNVREVS